MKLIIERFRTQLNCDKQTVGFAFVINDNNMIDYKFFTLELPDFNNQKKISSIPTGKYKVVKRHSPKYGNHFHILDVPERSYVLIHIGNYAYKKTFVTELKKEKMDKISILKKAGITSNFDKYEVEETNTSYKIYQISSETEGCVLPGIDLSDINKDGLVDTVSSGVVMKKLNEIMPNEFELEII